jgi:hypothetical protein
MSTQRSGYAHEDKDVYLHDDASGLTPKDTPDKLGHEKNGSQIPAYDGEIDLRRSVVVDTAEDLVTTVIGLEDDPSLNPWTFRAFFLGISLLPEVGDDLLTYTSVRTWLVCLWVCFARNLLFQTTDHLRFCCLPDCHWLCSW